MYNYDVGALSFRHSCLDQWLCCYKHIYLLCRSMCKDIHMGECTLKLMIVSLYMQSPIGGLLPQTSCANTSFQMLFKIMWLKIANHQVSGSLTEPQYSANILVWDCELFRPSCSLWCLELESSLDCINHRLSSASLLNGCQKHLLLVK